MFRDRFDTPFLRLLIWMIIMSVAGFHGSAMAEEGKRLHIISTTFPAYDFAKNIAEDKADISLLLPPGTESHSYEPTPQDIINIQNADLFLTVGGESEHWVQELLRAMGEKAPKTFSMIKAVENLSEETSASMAKNENENDHMHDEGEVDEHVWTSPKRACQISEQLIQLLVEEDFSNASFYKENGRKYIEELQALDAVFEKIVESSSRNKIILGDRFPFRYLAHDYGLEYDAAFPGCSEDSEPDIKTITSLIHEINRDHIPVVFYIEFSNKKTANILAEETGAKLLLLHSGHNVSAEELESGETYLTLMQKNAIALEEALR